MHQYFLHGVVAFFGFLMKTSKIATIFHFGRPSLPSARQFNSGFKFSTNFYKTICKKPQTFLFVVQFQRKKPHSKLLHRTYKGRRELKSPQRPTELDDLLDFEKAAQHRQKTQLLCLLPNCPIFEKVTKTIFILTRQPSAHSDKRQQTLKNWLSCRQQEL